MPRSNISSHHYERLVKQVSGWEWTFKTHIGTHICTSAWCLLLTHDRQGDNTSHAAFLDALHELRRRKLFRVSRRTCVFVRAFLRRSFGTLAAGSYLLCRKKMKTFKYGLPPSRTWPLSVMKFPPWLCWCCADWSKNKARKAPFINTKYHNGAVINHFPIENTRFLAISVTVRMHGMNTISLSDKTSKRTFSNKPPPSGACLSLECRNGKVYDVGGAFFPIHRRWLLVEYLHHSIPYQIY